MSRHSHGVMQRTAMIWVACALLGIGPEIRGEPVACCNPDQSCTMIDHENCVVSGGLPAPPDSACDGVSCPVLLWTQPPRFAAGTPTIAQSGESSCFLGWHARSVDEFQLVGAADFFLAPGDAIDTLFWWGSFADWRSVEDPAPRPSSFHIEIWENEAAGEGEAGLDFEHPGALVMETFVPYAEVGQDPSGCDLDQALSGNQQSCRRYEWTRAEPILSNPTPAPIQYWLSISASYSVDGCECYPDVAAPSGFVDFSDVAAIESLLGCEIGGDPDCALADANCDGAVDAFDVEAATCLAVGGVRDPACCIADTPHTWGWTTRPRASDHATDVQILEILRDETGATAISAERLVDGLGSDDWELSFVLAAEAGGPAIPPAPLTVAGAASRSRYLPVRPNQVDDAPVTLRLRVVSSASLPALVGTTWWIEAPATYPEGQNAKAGDFLASDLSCDSVGVNWNGIEMIEVFGEAIVPESAYAIASAHASCIDQAGDECFSDEVLIETGEWGDVLPPFGSTPSVRQPDVVDILAIVDKFLGTPDALPKARTQMEPNLVEPTESVRLADILAAVDSFLGRTYPHPGPASACSPQE